MPREPGERADETWRVKTGYHRDADGVLRGPGETFRPTVRQARSGSLGGKAERVRAHDRIRSTGANIGLRSLEWGSRAALRKALDAGLEVDEMEGVGATGATGFVTSDVERALKARH